MLHIIRNIIDNILSDEILSRISGEGNDAGTASRPNVTICAYIFCRAIRQEGADVLRYTIFATYYQ
jgi:hypothetical protein